MSRVGNAPVAIPDGVKVELANNVVKVTGPKGNLEHDYDPKISVKVEDGEVIVARPNDKPEMRAKHGLVRALINNMVQGVTEGYSKTLEIQGVGYRVALQGKTLAIQVGYSHPVEVEAPEGITFEVEGQNIIKVSGIDKQQVGQIAANIRGKRPPEPYKGKGIRYQGEYVRRKVGKAGTK